MKKRKIFSLLMATTMLMSFATGCGGGDDKQPVNSDGKTNVGTEEKKGDGVKEFTAFFAVPGSEINNDNEIQQLIADKTGVKVKETWLTGQEQEEAIGTLIAGGEYPDFIEGGNASVQLYEAGALVALDDYIEKYPNVKEFLT